MQGKDNQFLVSNIINYFSNEFKSFHSSGVSEKGLLDQEREIWSFLRGIGQHIQQAFVTARGTGYSGPRIDCTCHPGAQAHCKGRHRKAKLKTTFGDIGLDRAYYHCLDCKAGFHPCDDTLGLVDDGYSPYLIKSLSFASTGAESFKEGVRYLKTYLGVTIDPKQAREKVEKWGARIRGNLHEASEKLNEKEAARKKRIDPDPGRVLYGMVDGSHVPVRVGEDGVRVGTGAGGDRLPAKKRASKSTTGETVKRPWREMKLCRFFPGDSRASLSEGHGVILDSYYTCHLGDWETFSERVWALMLSIKAHKYETLVWLGDGASWIWSMRDWLRPENAVEILDWYHAVEHLWDCGHILFKDEDELGNWVKDRETFLWHGKVDQVIELLKDECTFRRGVKRKALKELKTYYEKNKDRMAYAEYRAKGYLIGSGPIESANRFVIQKRLKGSGMQWSADGADIMGLLRCLYKDGRWDQEWEKCLGKKKVA